MAHLLRIAAWCILLAVTGCSTKPAPHPVRDKTFVVDDAGVFTNEGRTRLRDLLRRIQKTTTAQFVVATVEKTAGNPRTKAIEMFNAWRLGKADQNNGILLLISRDDRAVEIVTGTGLDSKLPSAQLQDLLRQIVTPSIRAGQAEEGVVAAVKQIGWTLCGTRPSPAPQNLILLLALFGAVPGIAGLVQLHRLRYAPLRLPPTGRRDHTKDFRTVYQTAFFRSEAEAIEPKNARLYPANTVLLTWIGLSLLGAGLAGYLASLNADEPWLLVIWGTGTFCCLLTTLAMQPHADGDWERMGISAFAGAFLAALPAGSIVYGFVTPFVTSTILAAFALIVNTLAGWLWYRDLANQSARVDRFRCAKCKSELSILTDTKAFLNQWEKSAVERERVSFRGWQCKKCSADGAYLSCSILWDPIVCVQCKQFAVHPVSEKKNRLSLLCKACGHKRPNADYRPSEKQFGGGGGGGSYVATSNESSSSSYENNTWENSSSYDPPESGGSTSGGGAGDNW